MKTLPFAAILLPLALAACRSSAAHDVASVPPDPMVDLPGNPELEGNLETVDVRTTGTGAASTLEFGLRNKSSSALQFAWAVEWFDSAGARIPGSARAWTPATLEPGATCAIQIPLPSPDAVSWRLRAVRSGSHTLSQGDSR